ncbi:MAG: GIY-YIG nuclease family protein [Patescibacteria group bacterium]
MADWYVYILLCENDKFYTGIAKDPQQRLIAHQNKKGAKYTRINKPIKILYVEQCRDRSTALKREMQIKKMTKSKKINLVKNPYFG